MKTFVLLCSLALVAQSAEPVRILVCYHSVTGNTEKLAREVRSEVAAVDGVEVTLSRTSEFKPETVVRYDGVLLGSPVHWSNLSAEAKAFLDRIGDALWKAKTNGDGRTAGVFCTGGGVAMGKDLVRLSVLSAFLTMRYTVIGGVDDAGFGTLGPEATTGGGRSGVSEKELADARRFGERFARLTLRFRSAGK